jgi:Zn-dependent M28 family amino/carboxypeptidase
VNTLKEFGITPEKQRWRFPRIQNIVVDLLPDPSIRKMIFTAHYDKYGTSPGANDNASGVSVILGLCHQLKESRLPIKVIFFDREEAWLRTPILNLGLLGSLYYVLSNTLTDVGSVCNIELCGRGEFLGIWPVKEKQEQLEVVRSVQIAAEELQISYKTLHIPWFLFSSDHLSFRLRGFQNAVTLSLIPHAQVASFKSLLSGVRISHIIRRNKSLWPELIESRHTALDDSRHISESSLSLMLSLLLKLIEYKYG